ncbi:MAG TPA: (2Fe-2S)-binding protein [Terriglobales bacterium]|jgi:aerobic-type carbon monoxide dehydrogenase small subunit (CoxS/CutS family)
MADEPKSPPLKSRFSRRSFLKTAGLASAASAGSGLLQEVAAQVAEARNAVQGPGDVAIRLLVNGQQHALSAEPRTTLAEALRDHLHLTGTKIVCDRGSCSACTVMLDDTPVCSCMTLAIDAQGRKIRTIEGIGSPDHLHPVQAAFIEHDGMQCGFCTPGMVMSCTHLLESNPNPSLADIKQAISGNICRCGTYPKIFEAVATAAGAKTKEA